MLNVYARTLGVYDGEQVPYGALGDCVRGFYACTIYSCDKVCLLRPSGWYRLVQLLHLRPQLAAGYQQASQASGSRAALRWYKLHYRVASSGLLALPERLSQKPAR